jgi:hypothetical protein
MNEYPTSATAFIKFVDRFRYLYIDLPLSCGALCTKETATSRSNKITAFMMTTVCTAVGRRNEVAGRELEYICGNLCKVGKGIKGTLFFFA